MDKLALNALLAQLPELDALLRAEQIRRGPDAWLAAHQLLLARAGRDALPAEPQDWQALLAPLLCKSQDEQARFERVFATWWQGAAPATRFQAESPGRPEAIRWRERLKRFDRRSLRVLARVRMAVLLCLGLALLQHDAPPPPIPIKAESSPAVKPEPAAPAPIKPAQIDDWAPANRLPMPPPADARLDAAHAALLITPWLALAGWLLWRYRRRLLLRRDAPDGETLLHRLSLRAGQQALFASDAFSLRLWKTPTWLPSRRWSVAATAEATAPATAAGSRRATDRDGSRRNICCWRAACNAKTTARGWRASWPAAWTRPGWPCAISASATTRAGSSLGTATACAAQASRNWPNSTARPI